MIDVDGIFEEDGGTLDGNATGDCAEDEDADGAWLGAEFGMDGAGAIGFATGHCADDANADGAWFGAELAMYGAGAYDGVVTDICIDGALD